MPTPINLLIASYLEDELVERIRQVSPRLNVIYEPGLLPTPRYACDHVGTPRSLTPEQEARWRALLGQAEILYDFDRIRRQDLPTLASNLRWLQATSAGIGQYIKQNRYDERMPNTVFTTASGVFARPLAEFVFMALIGHVKGLPRLMREQQRKHWERFAGTDLEGMVMAIVGLGRNGSEIARWGRFLGLRTLGTSLSPKEGVVDQFYPVEQLNAMLAEADVLVLALPHTPKSDRIIGAAQIEALKPGAFFINIGRGQLVDEPALIAALQSGHISGAALDVATVEPLPQDNPLWEMPNVMISPHCASTSDHENRRLVELFCDNLHHYLNGEPLRNILVPERYY